MAEALSSMGGDMTSSLRRGNVVMFLRHSSRSRPNCGRKLIHPFLVSAGSALSFSKHCAGTINSVAILELTGLSLVAPQQRNIILSRDYIALGVKTSQNARVISGLFSEALEAVRSDTMSKSVPHSAVPALIYSIFAMALFDLAFAADGRSSFAPQYTGSGELVRPARFETWVFVGSNLGLVYRPELPDFTAQESARGDQPVFHNVYILISS
jgi:hypothetical protein